MEALRDWCARQVASTPGDTLALAPVAGDASFRRYYRLSGTVPSRIAVHAPPDKERNLEFIEIAALLRAAGVQAPEVLAHDQARGFLLLSDFGDRLLLGELDQDSVASLYARALETLLAIQKAATATARYALAPYGEALLRQELNLFPEWYLGGLLRVPFGDETRALFDELFGVLVQEALDQPQVLVHRDFHSRNLMLLDDGSLGVIDFQDAVRGPVTYDLVSLLRDCYVAWPEECVRAWALGYAERAVAAGILAPVDPERFLRWFDWMGLQRHIKVLGIFARLWLRDGKPGYLRDLPLVMRYTVSAAARYPETRAFAQWFADVVEPLAARQDWYRAA